MIVMTLMVVVAVGGGDDGSVGDGGGGYDGGGDDGGSGDVGNDDDGDDGDDKMVLAGYGDTTATREGNRWLVCSSILNTQSLS